MMKQLIYLISIAVILAFSGCVKDNSDSGSGGVIIAKDSSTVNLDFDFVYGEQDFNLNQVYDYSFGYELKFDKLNLYVSHISLVKNDGTVIEGSEIVFVNADTSAHNWVSFRIPVGDYSKIRFSIGVPPNLNGTDNPDFDAALYNADHPLSLNNGLYWTWNAGYRFILIDGRVNSNPMADNEFETLLSIHTGKDYSFRETEIAQQFKVEKEDTIGLDLRFDVSLFLENPDDVIDLLIDNQSHGENAPLANRVSDNAIKSAQVIQ